MLLLELERFLELLDLATFGVQIGPQTLQLEMIRFDGTASVFERPLAGGRVDLLLFLFELLLEMSNRCLLGCYFSLGLLTPFLKTFNHPLKPPRFKLAGCCHFDRFCLGDFLLVYLLLLELERFLELLNLAFFGVDFGLQFLRLKMIRFGGIVSVPERPLAG